MKLWVYHLPNAMKGHKYTDDVAVCYALTKEDAIKKFSRLYKAASEETVEEVSFEDNHGVAILTDY